MQYLAVFQLTVIKEIIMPENDEIVHVNAAPQEVVDTLSEDSDIDAVAEQLFEYL